MGIWQPGHIFHSGIQSKHQWHQPDQTDLQHRGCYRRGTPSALHPFGRKRMGRKLEGPQEKTHIFQTDDMLLPEGCSTEHEYRLMVSWEDACQWEPMDTEDFIRINVNMEQKD